MYTEVQNVEDSLDGFIDVGQKKTVNPRKTETVDSKKKVIQKKTMDPKKTVDLKRRWILKRQLNQQEGTLGLNV